VLQGLRTKICLFRRGQEERSPKNANSVINTAIIIKKKRVQKKESFSIDRGKSSTERKIEGNGFPRRYSRIDPKRDAPGPQQGVKKASGPRDLGRRGDHEVPSRRDIRGSG